MERKMVKVAFLINSMAGGGSERVVSILLKNLSRENKQFFLILLEDKICYDIPKDVKIIKLNSKFLGFLKLKKIIKENNIDTVISFLERSNYTNILAKKFGANHKVYIGERCNTLEYYSDKSFKSLSSLFLIRKLYKKADLIIVNSYGIKDMLVKGFKLNEKKIKTIYNPIDIEEISKLSKNPLDNKEIFTHPVIISVGRLIKEKGHKHLINAFKQVQEVIQETRLVILGEGELDKDLKELVKELKLEDKVHFFGFQRNPFNFLARSKIFVLSSLTEGFPNSLIEAMACNVPVISTNCPSGPSEIIQDQESGILIPVNDEKILAKSILKILKNQSLADKLSVNGRRKVEDFSVKNIIDQYEIIISNKRFAEHEEWWEHNISNRIEEMKRNFGDGYEKHKEYPRKLIKEMKYKSVLDGGAGLCAEYYGFQKDCPNIIYTGLDITPSFVRIGKERGINIFQGSIEKIPFPDNSFDCVYVRDTMRHLMPSCEKALEECLRVAKKELMVLFCIKLNNTSNHILHYEHYNPDLSFGLYNNSYSKKRIKELLKKNQNIKFFYFETIDGKTCGNTLLRIFKEDVNILLRCKLYISSRYRMHICRNPKVFYRFLVRLIKKSKK
ncbi:glycosyltransferase [Patescibacteria group bacterium]|nr:glycosyltransferase [Patescibacteria group bacterium]